MGAAQLAHNQVDAAIATLEGEPSRRSNQYFSILAPAYAAAGQFGKSADTIN
jgi:hypothetical protein